MSTHESVDRRTLLKLSSGAIVLGGLSGCVGSDDDSREDSSSDDERPSESGDNIHEVELVYNIEWSGPWMEEYQQVLASALEGIGLRTNLVQLSFGDQAAEIVGDGGLTEYDFSTLNQSNTPARAIDPWEILHSRSYSESGANFGGIADPILDELFDEGENEFELDNRSEIVKQILERQNEIIVEVMPVFSNYIDAYNSEDWTGWTEVPGGGVASNMWEWSFFNVESTTGEDSLVIGTAQEVESSNKFVSDVIENIGSILYDPLIRLTPDFEIVPWAATDISYGEGGDSIDITVREGMTWHDGNDVTADDVAFSINYMKENQQGTQNVPVWDPTVGAPDAEVVNDNVVRIYFSEPTPGYDTFRSLRFRVIPKHQWEGQDQTEFSPDPPIGSGPFKWKQWDRGSRLVLEAHEDHWSGYPNVNELIFSEIPSVDGQLGALQSKEIDAVGSPLSPQQARQIEQEPHISIASTPRFIPVWTYFNFNTRELFNDHELRRAIMYAIDRQELVQGVLDGEGQANPWNSRVHPDQEQWFSTDQVEYEYDLERAREILADSGYTWDDDGYLQYPSGEHLEDYEERVNNPFSTAEELGQ